MFSSLIHRTWVVFWNNQSHLSLDGLPCLCNNELLLFSHNRFICHNRNTDAFYKLPSINVNLIFNGNGLDTNWLLHL